MKTLLVFAFLVILGVVFAEEMQNGQQEVKATRDVPAPAGDGSQRRDGRFFGLGLYGGYGGFYGGYPYYGGYGGYWGGGYGGYGYPYGYYWG